MSVDDRFTLDKYIIYNSYQVPSLGFNPDGISFLFGYSILNESGKKLFTLKVLPLDGIMKIEFCDSPDSKVPILTVIKDKKFQFLASYSVLDSQGTAIGSLKNKMSLIREKWVIKDGSNTDVGQVVGRFTVGLPCYEIYLNNIRVGFYKRKFGPLQQSTIDLSQDPEKKLDRRLAIGFGIAIDVSTNGGSFVHHVNEKATDR